MEQLKVMKTKILDCKAEFNITDLVLAKEVLEAKGLVAFPTETVYGLGANGLDKDAVAGIYQAKGRPSDNPLILHIGSLEQLEALVTTIDPRATEIINAFWPGPLTIVLPKAGHVPYEVTGGLDTVAVRMPNHPVALALLKLLDFPLAAPSANLSGKPSPTTAEHVYKDLQGKIDLILDGGAVGLGLESTVLDLSGETPYILRPGIITLEDIQELLPNVEYDPALAGDKAILATPKAPGMKYTHYAPEGEVFLVKAPNLEQITKTIQERVSIDLGQGKKVGILATSETAKNYPQGEVLELGTRQDLAQVASRLYGALRRCDELNLDSIYIEAFPETGLGVAVMNRLLKAAGYKVISE